MVFPRLKAFAVRHRKVLTVGTFCMLSLARLTPPVVLAEGPVTDPEQYREKQTYLYGESAQANQVGKGYIIFQRQGQSVVGAFHYPESEFSCFVGDIQAQQLQVLTLESEYEASLSVDVSLSKLHTIETIGSSEKNSLRTCQQAASVEQQQNIVQLPTHSK